MSHTSGNDMDEDFKAWEEGEQNFDKESIKSSPLHANFLNSRSEWPSINPQTSSWERASDIVTLISSSKLAIASVSGIKHQLLIATPVIIC